MSLERLKQKTIHLHELMLRCGSTSDNIAAYKELWSIYRKRYQGTNPIVELDAKRLGRIAVRPNSDDAWIAYELQNLYQLPSRLVQQIARTNGKNGIDLLDLGANIGLASRRFHKQLVDHRVNHQIVAVEPDANNFEIINRNIALAQTRQFGTPIIPVQAAIGPDFDKLQLVSPFGSTGTCTYLYIERHTNTLGTPDSFDGVQSALDEFGFLKIEGYGIAKDGREPDDMMYVKEDLL